MKLGIVGLPNVGKSTLFNAITGAQAAAANYPFCTIEPNVGVVAVPDPRLDKLAQMYNPEKITPAIIEFADIAGLVRGAGRGEGLGNQFLSHIREVDAIVHVVRCFEDDDVVHVDGSIDALRDIETIDLELIFSDIEMTERRIDRVKKSLKGDKSFETELKLLERAKAYLESGKCLRGMEVTEEEQEILKNIAFLTTKPVIFAANMGENDFQDKLESNRLYNDVCRHAEQEKAAVIPVCARFEEEISHLSAEEKKEFLSDLGLNDSGLDRLATACYSLLNLISYLTAGPKEVRAWTITRGTKAPQAAGKIHSDFERGFIRAEIVSYDDLMNCGTMVAAKEMGLVRSEGKEYVVKDGDIVVFRFNV